MSLQTFQCKDYTVAWISAIEKEYLVACEALDEEHGEPKDLDNDNGCYTFGCIREHKVVVACLATMGVLRAAMLAEKIQSSFPNLRFGLLVGIAGGAPSEDKDIRLGDVVVGEPSESNRHGGVIDYDSGATVQEQGFKRRGYLLPPPEILLNATKRLKFEHARHGHHLHSMIQRLVERKASLIDYCKPPTTTDMLFRSSYIHSTEFKSCDESCRANISALIHRRERLSDKPHVVHYGTIASGQKLLRDANMRDKMAKEDDVLCFEMEAAGILTSDLRCTVVRGICDYADTHKNDRWQNYAAAAATVYAKQLLSFVRPQKNTGRIKGSVDVLISSQRDVLDVLRFENMHDKEVSSVPKKYCDHDWIWRTPFPTWLSSPDQFFWISGKPGSGKSTLVSYLTRREDTLAHLQAQDKSFKILHFYFDYRAGTSLANNIIGMFRMFLFQLTVRNTEAKAYLKRIWLNGGLDVDSQPSLFNATCDVIKEAELKFCIFIDGIDEFEGDLLELIDLGKRLMESTPVKLCLVSRPDDRIGQSLDVDYKITMQNHNEESMRKYVDWKIKQQSAADLSIGERFSPQLVDRLVHKAQGVLLWFRIAVDEVMDRLEQGCSEEHVDELVQTLPLALDEMYTRMLNQISPKQRPEAALMLYLTDKLRSLSSWTKEGVEPQMEFTTTNLDHLWGAYDFIADHLGSEIGLSRLKDESVLQDRTRKLLRGLVEFAPAEEPEATVEDLCGVTNLNVRYVHETFSAYVSDTDWVDRHLPRAIQDHFDSSFWLSFSAKVIEKAAGDQIIKPDILRDGMREMNSFLKTNKIVIEEGDFSAAARCFYHFAKMVAVRRSVLFALHSEFCPAAMESVPDTSSTKKLFNFVTSQTPDVALPPTWKSRHVMLRTSLFLLPHLALRHEITGKSSYPVIAKSMQSYLKPILGYGWWRTGKAVDLDLLRTLHKSPHLMEVYDLFLAISGNLTLYLRDRLIDSSLSTTQKDFLFQTILSHPRASRSPPIKALESSLSTMTSHYRRPQIIDLCSYFKRIKCWKTAAEYATALRTHVSSKDLEEAQSHHECCQGMGKEVGLLYHWASTTCAQSCHCGGKFSQTAKNYSDVLELLISCGLDINAPCFSGGTVLQVVLDPSVQAPSHRGPLNRYAKFLALIDHGLNPDVETKSGDAHQTAKTFKYKVDSRRNLHRYPGGYAWSINATHDERDIQLIIQDLDFYKENKEWSRQADPGSTEEDRPKMTGAEEHPDYDSEWETSTSQSDLPDTPGDCETLLIEDGATDKTRAVSETTNVLEPA